MSEIIYSVGDLIYHLNNAMNASFANIVVEGEVASYKVNQGKWVFFDLKELPGEFSTPSSRVPTLNCFMPIWKMGVPLEDGMKVRVRVVPKLAEWGKFSLTVEQIIPLGEGSIKKSFELLKKKLMLEGLFAAERKRPLPDDLERIGVISSINAAGYIDFLQILENRWSGIKISTVNTQVQGLSAPEQIVRALELLNQRSDIQVIAILRGGGSQDDLAAFNDENLVRAIAASKIPVITGIGHEIDESLADLAADVRASTPSNAAERLVPDRHEVLRRVYQRVENLPQMIVGEINQQIRMVQQSQRFAYDKVVSRIELMQLKTRQKTQIVRNRTISAIDTILTNLKHKTQTMYGAILRRLEVRQAQIRATKQLLETLNPNNALKRGYAIVKGKLSPGNVVEITTYDIEIAAEIKSLKTRKD